jgi:peroxiredoxin family protein
LYALTIASTSAVLGKKVHVLFTYGGLIRLKKGCTDRVKDETDAWVRKTIKTQLQKGNIRKISELLTELRKFGGKIYACPAAMAFHNTTADELIEEVHEVRGITAFLEEAAKNASMALYV